MIMRNRSFNILDYIIRDYIDTAEPVSSGRIYKKIRGSISPATIRNVMGELSEEGYLEQPHTSAGRIPTDKAYRYFVDTIFKEQESSVKKKIIPPAYEKDARDFVQELSEELGMCTMFAMRADKIFWAGMEEVFNEPEFQEHDVARAFVSLIENISMRIEYYYEYEGEFPHVLIGKENPFPDAIHFSSVIGRPDRSHIIITLGPKRMDYEHITRVLRRFLS